MNLSSASQPSGLTGSGLDMNMRQDNQRSRRNIMLPGIHLMAPLII